MNPQTTVDKSWSHIHPLALPLFTRLMAELQIAHRDARTHSLYSVLEGWRHPARQAYLYTKKKSARDAWEHPSQYGLSLTLSAGAQPDLSVLGKIVTDLGLMIQPDEPTTIYHPVWQDLRQHL